MTKIKIYPWATDTAGCFYQRLKMPLDALERYYGSEFEVCWSCEPRSGDGPAVVLGQRIMGNGAEHDARWIGFCADEKIMAVYEIDDDILDIDPANTVPHNIFAPNRAGTLGNIAASDHVIASTANLACKLAREIYGQCYGSWAFTVAPNCIKDNSVIERDWPRHNDFRPTIGWAGSMFHQQDFPRSTVVQFDQLAATRPELNWVSIGANYLGRGSTFGWDQIERYHQRLTRLDIGIAPIVPTEFNRSKSWIKVLDYMAHGVIPVASNWGQYPEIIVDGENGHIVADGEWLETINGLLDIGQPRLHAMRQAALRTARRHEIGNHVALWADVFRKAREFA